MLPDCDEKLGLHFTESSPRGSPGNTEGSGLFFLHQSKLSHRKDVAQNSWVSPRETFSDLKTL